MADIKWVISIIAQFEAKHAYAYQNLLDSILNQAYNPAIRYYILKYTNATKNVDITTLEYDSAGPPHKFKQLCNFDTDDFYNDPPTILTDFFNTYSLNESNNAVCHFVMTWGHGAGFGFFPDDFPVEFKAQIEALKQLFSRGVVGFNLEQVVDKFFSIISNNALALPGNNNNAIPITPIQLRQAFEIMPTTVFNEALTRSFKERGKSVTFLYTMNCFMQTFETGYLLKDNVKYLIGAETFHSFFGPEYRTMFADLASFNDTPKDVLSFSQRTINNYFKKYEDPGLQEIIEGIYGRGKGQFTRLSLSVNNLQNYTDLRLKIDELANYLLNNQSNDLYRKLATVKKRCADISEGQVYGIIDILHFIEQAVSSNLFDAKLIKLLNEVLSYSLSSNVIISQKAWANACIPPRRRIASICPKGLSIFFPFNRGREDQLIQIFIDLFYREAVTGANQKYLNAFLTDSTWDQFVLRFYDSGV